jgi:secreted Zn-dependent insulinase-like peptidase
MSEQLPLLETMSPDAFEAQKLGLITRLTERDKNLRERTSRYLADLDVDETGFDSQARIADIVATLTLKDMRRFYGEVLSKLAERRVLIYSMGRFEDAPDGVPLEDASALKAD